MQSTKVGHPIRVALVNDYQIIVEGLQEMLEPFAARVLIVDEVAGGLPTVAADIALFDTFAGKRHALERVRAMLADGSIGKVVLYTWDAPAEFLDDVTALQIDGVILKSAKGDDLVEALERVHQGEQVGLGPTDGDDGAEELTYREREVLALLASGASNRVIADELYISIDTVKTHVRRLFRKLGVHNRTQAAMTAKTHRLAVDMNDTRQPAQIAATG